MKWDKRLKIMRLSTVIIAVCLVLLVIFAGFTYYGDKVGNFVISIHNSDIKLALSEKEDLSDATARLTVKGMENQTLATYSFIPDDISAGLGSKNDLNDYYYMAFSFYLINYSSSAVDYDVSLNIIDTIGDPTGALRVLLIEGDGGKDAGTVYAKEEASESDKQWLDEQLKNFQPYEASYFLTEKQIFYQRKIDLQPNDKVKYTVVIWLEGCDIDGNNARYGERIKMEMNFYGKK